MLRILSILLTLAVILAAGCTKPRSWGELYEVTVLADHADWERIEAQVDELFDVRWITPQDERSLGWERGDPQRLEEYLNRRNLLVIGTGPAQGPVRDFLAGILSTELKDQIQREEHFALAREGAFALDQQLLILAAPTVLSFLDQLEEWGPDVRRTFIRHERRLQREGIYRHDEQDELADSVETICGSRLRVPLGWFIAQVDEQADFLRLRRVAPDRWITIHWVQGDDSLRHTEEGLRAVRTRLGRRYLDLDYCEAGYGRFSLTRLGSHSASLFEGLWGTDEYLGGGPFLCWALYLPGAGGPPQDELRKGGNSTGRTYYIDAAVLNPGGRKSPFLHQLTTIVETFGGGTR